MNLPFYSNFGFNLHHCLREVATLSSSLGYSCPENLVYDFKNGNVNFDENITDMIRLLTARGFGDVFFK